MITHRRARWPATLLIPFILTACSSSGGQDVLGGDASPVQSPSESHVHTPEDLEGVITLEPSGCWTIDLGEGKRLVVFPAGYTKDESGRMVSGDGNVNIGDGAEVIAKGEIIPAASFPGVPDGYWGNYLTFCNPAIAEFAVLDEIISVQA